MRVLALTPSFFGSTGGAVNERQFLMALARKVEKCYVVAFVSSKQFFIRRRDLKVDFPENMTLIPLPVPRFNLLIVCLAMICISCLASIVSLMLNALKKLDLIYIRNSLLSMGFLTFRSLARKTVVKIPAIVEDEVQNEGIAKSLIKKVASFTDRLALSRAKKVGVNNRLLYNELVRRRRFKHKDRPLEIPPGVNLNLIKKVKSQTKEASARNTLSIGFLGSLAWWQGVDILVKAVRIVQNKKSNVKLIIIGDGPMRTYIENLAKALNVNFEITGLLPHEKALEIFSTVDVLVLPRRRMSSTELIIPVKVIEAWALRIPVIITPHKAFLSEFRDGIDVIYAEPIPEDIADKILLLLSDRELYERLSKNGPLLAKKFDYNVMVDNLISRLMCRGKPDWDTLRY